MRIPRLDPEAGLARGCGEEEERIKNHPVITRIHQVPGGPLAPHTGYSFGPRSPRPPASGRGSKGLHPEDPLICPASPPHALTRGRIAEGRRLALPPTR
jgi:hypothetical protein